MFKRIVHPGEILKDKLNKLNIAPTEFAHQIDVPLNRVRRSSPASAPSRATGGSFGSVLTHLFAAAALPRSVGFMRRPIAQRFNENDERR